jgi:hypothetical protein
MSDAVDSAGESTSESTSESRRLRSVAKRAVAPFERRIEIAVTRAVEASVRREITELQAALRADIATLLELTYELERVARRIEDAAIAPATSRTDG